MRRALKILVNVQETYMCRVVAQNVRREEKVVTEWLIRGHYAKTEAYDSKSSQNTWGDEKGYMEEW